MAVQVSNDKDKPESFQKYKNESRMQIKEWFREASDFSTLTLYEKQID